MAILVRYVLSKEWFLRIPMVWADGIPHGLVPSSSPFHPILTYQSRISSVWPTGSTQWSGEELTEEHVQKWLPLMFTGPFWGLLSPEVAEENTDKGAICFEVAGINIDQGKQLVWFSPNHAGLFGTNCHQHFFPGHSGQHHLQEPELPRGKNPKGVVKRSLAAGRINPASGAN